MSGARYPVTVALPAQLGPLPATAAAGFTVLLRQSHGRCLTLHAP